MERTTHKKNEFFVPLLFLAFVLVVWIGLALMPVPTQVDLSDSQDGSIDITSDSLKGTVYHFSGSWESYPNKLYAPQDFSTGNVHEAPRILNDSDYQTVQYMTHVLAVRLMPGVTYGISLKSCDYSMRALLQGHQKRRSPLPHASDR